MPAIDHNDPNLSIYQMVLNRLPFVEDTPENTTLISQFTLEVMVELEPCFLVGALDPMLIGHEEYYTVIMQSIIADVVAAWLMMWQTITVMGGGSGGGASAAVTKFLSKAKAGSVEVEWKEGGVSSSGGAGFFSLTAPQLISSLMRSANRKMLRYFPCVVSLCEECEISIEILMNRPVKPFKVGDRYC